jgi:hypothetical protein
VARRPCVDGPGSGNPYDMTAELLSALVLCASVVVTLVAALQQARHERRRAEALDERWAPRPGRAVLDAATDERQAVSSGSRSGSSRVG